MGWNEHRQEESRGVETIRMEGVGDADLSSSLSLSIAEATEALSHSVVYPDQYIVGRPARTLVAVGPSGDKVMEFEKIRESAEWGVHASRVLKWAKTVEAGRLVGSESVTAFRK